ncbi:MAG: glycosyltransferase [Anaerolineae bacterium]|nr:glycosyltransferase [Anaerolineae bacterium]
MKVAMLPRSPWWRENPYLDLLETGLKQLSVVTADDPNDGLSWRWLLQQRSVVDVLHLQWVQYHYNRDTAPRSVWALSLFTAKLILARLLGYRLVWTLHNLQPHEHRHPQVDRAAWRILALLVHRVIVHCEETGRQLSLRFGRRQGVYVLPHPNYAGVYPPPPSQEDARRQLGFNQKHLIFLCFGIVRPYKGFQEAIAAFKEVTDADARLVIAGRPINEAIAQEIKALAQDDRRIVTVLHSIPNNDLPTFFSAADVVVLPFRTITTSGSAILAMSLARPVIAPALGCLPELITEESGVLYDPDDPESLAQAMRHCRRLDLKTMGCAAYERVAPFTPAEVAAQHLKVYQVKSS